MSARLLESTADRLFAEESSTSLTTSRVTPADDATDSSGDESTTSKHKAKDGVANATLSVRERTEAARTQILKWILPSTRPGEFSSETQYKSYISQWHPETCQWIHDHSSYQSWLAGRTPLPLFITSLPGSGKTILSSTIVHHLRENGHQAILFYFSEARGQRSAESMLKCLAHDLLMVSDIVPNDLANLYEDELASNQPTLNNMFTAVRVVEILLKTIKRVHVIIDGINECQDREKLFLIIPQLLKSKKYGVVKWLFTSRPDYNMREKMHRLEVVEISVPTSVIRADVRLMIRARSELDLSECLKLLYDTEDEFEANFQWALKFIDLMKEIIAVGNLEDGISKTIEQLSENETSQGEKLTQMPLELGEGGEVADSKAIIAVIEAIMQLPRSVNGLYVRSLNQIGTLSSDKQRLSKRLLAFVMAAQRPLRVSELAHALITTSKVQDYATARLPTAALIGKLGTDLILIDYSDDTDDPNVRAPHKSALEFLRELDRTPGLSRAAREVLTDEKVANRMLGEACLQYLCHPRYSHVKDIPSIIDHKDHAFLRYASVSWHHHLNVEKPSAQLLARVQDFMKSPNFWTCLAVQSCVAPMIFARHIVEKNGQLQSVIGNQLLHNRTDKVEWGLFMPWYAQSSRTKAFLEMIIQWHHVLNTYPDSVEFCRMHDTWESKWPEYWQWVRKSKGPGKVISSSVQDEDRQNLIALLHTRSPARLCCAFREASGLTIHSKAESASKEVLKCYCESCAEAVHNKARATCFIEDSAIGRALEYVLTTRLIRESTDSLEKPLDTNWNFTGYNTNYRSAEHLQCIMTTAQYAKIDPSRRKAIPDQRKRVTVGLSFVPQTDNYRIDMTVMTAFRDNCLLIYRQGQQPRQYFWSSEHSMVHVLPAFHPKTSAIYWTAKPGKFCALSGDDDRIEEFDLPEPGDLDVKPNSMMYRELRLSADFRQLYYVLFTIRADETSLKHTLAVTTYDFHETEMKLTIAKTKIIRYSSFGSIIAPGTMTSWINDTLFIVMPPLASKPKIVRLNLGTMSDFETLKEAVFFPATTLSRRPRFLAMSADANYDNLVLLLAAEIPSNLKEESVTPTPPRKIVFTSAPKDETFSEDVLQGPFRLAWKIHRNHDWRAWDDGEDAESDEHKLFTASVAAMRGSFVSKYKPIPLTTRSGRDWKKQQEWRCTDTEITCG